jgi:all-trans-8'-apo-beta-carotenal 15,15'-oxygenase
MNTVTRERLAHYLRASEAVSGEVDATLTIVEGALPAELRGVLYRNGPGKMDVFGVPYDHPFDGDGMVVRFAFDGTSVVYRNRFVRTREYVAEERAGRMLFRSFGTNLPGGLRPNFFNLRFKNAANTSVVHQGGKLLALWEGGMPHELDPVTLATRGRYDFGGRLKNTTSRLARLVAPELPFSAHPKRDVVTGELVNFGALLGRKNQLVTYRVGADGVMGAPSFTPMGALSFVHDFVLTEHYAVFFLSAVSFRVPAMFLGLTTPVGSLTANDDAPARLFLVPRDGGAAITVAAKPGFLFHFANGYEDGEGRVVLDAMRMDTLAPAKAISDFFRGQDVPISPPRPTRLTIDLDARRVTESVLGEHPADLPTIDARFAGRPYRYFWAIAGAPDQEHPFLTHVLRFDHQGRAQARDFSPDIPGEPIFVPRTPDAPEGDGFLLTLVYRTGAHRSELYVLDASDLSTVCRLELPHHVPPGFHGIWVPSPG